MKRTFIFFSFIVIFFQVSCKKYINDKFTLTKTEYNGNQLRIDGYYYSNVYDNYYNLIFFYKNGVILKKETRFEYIESEIKVGSNVKTDWGLFKINNNTIKIEYYIKKMIEGLPAYIKSGEIIDDTTLVLKKEYRSNDSSNFTEINEIYHFQKLDSKPDSTNSFVK